MDRRRFLLGLGAVVLVGSIYEGNEYMTKKKVNQNRVFKTDSPKKALVIWYSPTENTQRYAELACLCLQKAGLETDIFEYREVKLDTMPNYDFILMGAPVYNWQIPPNILEWLKTIPDIEGVPVASFVSFGGPEGNQHNSACQILDSLTEKNGIPVGIDYFMNMSTFPTENWDSTGQIQHKDLPNAKTYKQVQDFCLTSLENIKKQTPINAEHKFAMRDFLTYLPLIRLEKMTVKHTINAEKCVKCGICVQQCPVDAIDIHSSAIDKDKCILCFACFNRCPEQAVQMSMNKKELYNYAEFKRRNNIQELDYRAWLEQN